MMKKIIVSFTVAFMVCCTSNTTDEITGKWRMYKVIQNGKDVTSEHNPNNDRFLILKSDSTFESGGAPYGKNTGRYLFSSGDKTLFLDSDAGPEDDSKWKVGISNDTMYWQGYGSEWAGNFELVHLRVK